MKNPNETGLRQIADNHFADVKSNNFSITLISLKELHESLGIS